MNRKQHAAFPMGDKFFKLINKQSNLCSKWTDEFAATSGQKLPSTVAEIGSTLSIMYRLACCAWGCGGGDHQVQWLAGRVVNQALGAHSLVRGGFYDESLALIRGVGEIANLLWLFNIDVPQLGKWQKASPKARLEGFSPASVRRKLEQTVYRDVTITADRYRKLCEIGVHPMPGITPAHYTGTGRPMLGGMMQPVGVYVCLSELGYAVGASALPLIDLLNPDKDVKQLLFDASARLMNSLGGFNIITYDRLLKDALEKHPEAIDNPTPSRSLVGKLPDCLASKRRQ
jgi:hypothetical protein